MQTWRDGREAGAGEVGGEENRLRRDDRDASADRNQGVRLRQVSRLWQ